MVNSVSKQESIEQKLQFRRKHGIFLNSILRTKIAVKSAIMLEILQHRIIDRKISKTYSKECLIIFLTYQFDRQTYNKRKYFIIIFGKKDFNKFSVFRIKIYIKNKLQICLFQSRNMHIRKKQF